MSNAIPSGAEWLLDEYDAARFWAHVNFHGGETYRSDPLATADGECWLWSEPNPDADYGRFKLMGQWLAAHRVAFRDFGGKLPDELQLDHLCRVHNCVRPSHLDPVTQTENTRRGINGNKTMCPSGHEYTEDNTVVQIRNGRSHRYCRTCLRASKRKTYLRRKEAGKA